MTVRIAVIGTGVMGSDHARTLAGSVAGAEVVALADLDADRAASLSRELGARWSADPHELIRADDVDAIVVATHDSTHAELVLAAIEASKPVLCEKPLSLDVAECAAILEAEVTAEKRLVSVGFSRRFDPENTQIRAAIQGDHMGRVLMTHAIHRNVTNDPNGDSASTILGSAIHELDQIPWLLSSEAVEVSWHAGLSTRAMPLRQDPQLVLLRTADGALNTIEVFVSAEYGYDVRLEVVSERGTASYGEPAGVTVTHALARSRSYPADWRPRYAEAYRLELQAWVRSVSTGDTHPDLASAAAGYRATAVAHAVIASMNDGGRTQRIALPDAELLAQHERTFG